MAKRKKPIPEMTDQELERYVFPKKVYDEIQRIAHEGDDEEDSQPSQEESST